MTPRVETAARKLITFMDMSKYDLAREVFCDPRTAQRILKMIHAEQKCNIVAWTKAHNQWIPVYGRTSRQKDMPKPEPLTRHEIYRRYFTEEVSWKAAMKKRAKRIIERVGV